MTRFGTELRFDGIAARDPLPLPEGAEVFLRGASFAGSVLVEDINGTRGLVGADTITIRPASIVSRCDLIPTAVTAAAAAAGNAGALQAPVTSGNIAIVNTGNLNIRSGPSANFASVAVVPGGTRLNVVARSRDNVWFLVEGPFGRGWVNNTFVIFRGVYDTIPVIN
ncbi:MAG: SH3 domain-containing protein [Aggregatilineales bacterium]